MTTRVNARPMNARPMNARRLRRTALSAAGALALSVVWAGAAPAQTAYALTDLGASAGHVNNLRLSLNASGAVAGSTHDAAGAKRAFRWTPSSSNTPTGTLSLLPLLRNTTTSDAGPINSQGQVSGMIFTSSGSWSAVVWQPDGTITQTRAPAGDCLNDAGEVAGTCFANLKVPTYPFLWSAGTSYNLSSQIPGPYVEGLNASGQIVGNATNSDTNSPLVCYLWTPAVAHGTSGTSVQLPLHAFGLNDAGQVAGDTAAGAALYAGGAVQQLGTLPGYFSEAICLNNVGQVAGTLYGDTAQHAFLWDAGHGLRDLNDPTQFTLTNPDGTPATGWVLSYVAGINDSGQMVGYGSIAGGPTRNFLLTPR